MKNLLSFMFAPLPLLAPDTGGGGGSAEPLDFAPWLERLKAAPGKERPAIAGELAKALGVPINEAWKRLKEAGWDNKAGAQPSGETPPSENGGGTPPERDSTASPPDAGDSGDPPPPDSQTEAVETKPVLIRHKTSYPKYRCAGLVLNQKPETYQVTEAQLEKLRRDPWVVIEKEPAPK
jgi:hypothetical protein